ncbi:Rv2175c family DNA-binding protein [Demequina capsici]|uniref:Rv2175c family DNA-binding protein n=1 Tax=Demequina capsici TaxID=3075620 RepID=A0AA96JAR1_9MICO|nr:MULTISPECIES: Rv2175c family DNA-binding protein [unclassified Demequina]WNM25692.1 Rv2175c family DNA-binding protein [Demequina sp. OYTSA14]WNM28587.1 Rv2175c family DNA-binding protein [Demequina sp. PMTSA13]
MSTDVEWLSIPEFASRISVRDARVRDLLRDRALIAVRRGENSALMLPADFIVPGDHAPHVLATLKGTLTVLFDAGFDDDAAMEWLFTFAEELGATPMAALREGQRAPVRRLAQALL